MLRLIARKHALLCRRARHCDEGKLSIQKRRLHFSFRRDGAAQPHSLHTTLPEASLENSFSEGRPYDRSRSPSDSPEKWKCGVSDGGDDPSELCVSDDDTHDVPISMASAVVQEVCDDALGTAMTISHMLEVHGWGLETEMQLRESVGTMTIDLIVDVVRLTKNRNAALKYMYWAIDQEGFEYGHLVLAKVVGRLGRNRDFENAWGVLLRMKEKGLDVNHAFSVYLHRLGRARMVDGIVTAIGGMPSLNVAPTLSLYTTAMDFIMKGDKVAEAQRLHKQMLHIGLKADKKLYEIMIKGLCRAQQFNEAIVLFEEMKSVKYTPSVSVYSGFIAAFSMARKMRDGRKFYDEMVGNGVLPKIFTRHEVACALHGKNITKQVNDFLTTVQMTASSLRIHSYHNLIEYLFETDKCNEAIKIFERIPRSKINVALEVNNQLAACKRGPITYKIMLYGLCKQGRMTYALEILKEMMASGHEPDTDIHNHLLISLSEAKMLDEVLELCKQFMKAKISISDKAQQSVLGSLRVSGRLDEACKIFLALRRKGCINEDTDFVSVSGVASIGDNDKYKSG